MAGNPFRKLKTGDRLPGIPKDAWNAFIDQARGLKTQAKTTAKLLARDPGIVFVRNDSGAARTQFQILGLDGPVITPTDNEAEFKRDVIFKGITPTTASHPNKFCVLIDPLPHIATAANRGLGRAVISGVVPVRLTGADVGFATVTNNDATKLTADASGSARVLWADSGSSERWALVRLAEAAPATAAALSGARVYGTSSQSITSGGNNSVLWNSEDYDTDGYHSTSSNTDRLTVPTDGYYLIQAQLTWSGAAAGGLRGVEILVSGSTPSLARQRHSAGASTLESNNASTVYFLAAGSYVTCNAFQSSGANLTLQDGTTLSWFAITRLTET